MGGYDTATTVIIKSGDKTGETTTNQPIHLKTEEAYWRKNYLLRRLVKQYRYLDPDTDTAYIDYGVIWQLYYFMKSALYVAAWKIDKDDTGNQVLVNRKRVEARLGDINLSALSDEELITGLEEGVKELEKVIASHKRLVESGVDEDDIEYTYEESW